MPDPHPATKVLPPRYEGHDPHDWHDLTPPGARVEVLYNPSTGHYRYRDREQANGREPGWVEVAPNQTVRPLDGMPPEEDEAAFLEHAGHRPGRASENAVAWAGFEFDDEMPRWLRLYCWGLLVAVVGAVGYGIIAWVTP